MCCIRESMRRKGKREKRQETREEEEKETKRDKETTRQRDKRSRRERRKRGRGGKGTSMVASKRRRDSARLRRPGSKQIIATWSHFDAVANFTPCVMNADDDTSNISPTNKHGYFFLSFFSSSQKIARGKKEKRKRGERDQTSAVRLLSVDSQMELITPVSQPLSFVWSLSLPLSFPLCSLICLCHHLYL